MFLIPPSPPYSIQAKPLTSPKSGVFCVLEPRSEAPYVRQRLSCRLACCRLLAVLSCRNHFHGRSLPPAALRRRATTPVSAGAGRTAQRAQTYALDEIGRAHV